MAAGGCVRASMVCMIDVHDVVRRTTQTCVFQLTHHIFIYKFYDIDMKK